MTAFQLLFYLLSAASIVGGIGVVWSTNVVHSALFLVLSLSAVAGVFLVLFADFLALVQILIYGGAITILILFAMMLTRVADEAVVSDSPQKPWGVAAAAAFFGITAYAIYNTPWNVGTAAIQRVPFRDLGVSLFTQWAIPFEVASLVLLVGLIGAIIIARPEDRE
ncbi:MAG: NADH-quinone oxidoreductase subunit J [Dehalococcoidia bacterium]|nr:NADH-quinone oxidoreductase subunit J [Dehalococcoidia bacterium]